MQRVKLTYFSMGVLSIMILLSSCSQGTNTVQQNSGKTSDNPLSQEWVGPYGGIPAFDKMNLADVKSAMEAGISAKLAEIEAIANDPNPPTFENTIVARQKAGSELDRVETYYYLWRSNLSSAEYREIQKELIPQISEMNSRISQNEKLFARIKTVYEQSRETPLETDQQRVVTLMYDNLVMSGAELDEASKKRYAEINKEMSQLHTQFANNVLADEESYVTYLTEDQLSGLSESYVKSAAKAAADRGQEGKFAITNTRSSMSPFLMYSDERDLREKVWRNYYARGNNGDEFDNNALISRLLKLRDERVGLLGYDNYASWRLQNRMAQTPERAMELLTSIWPAALARVEEEVADMQALADARGDDISIAPWDYRYYAEKVRQEKYDLNSEEVKQYLQMNQLIPAMFYTAGELFNFTFAPVPEGSVPVFQEDVKVWEVTDKTSGDHIGLWYLDPYARKGKRSGAWATTYRSHSTYDGKKTVLASNNSNFVKPAPGEPLLVSWDDANTLFHEFGHALHFLSSRIRYPYLNRGVKDYTEFQSQLLERWLSTDRVIDQFLKHQETGEPMPADLVAKIKKASTFNQGFSTTEYLASAIMDLKYHTADPTNLDPQTFERETLASLNLPEEIVMRHRSTQFSHVFSSENYAAAYYGYIWAEVLTSDAAEAFAEAPDGYYDKALGEKLVKYLFAPRNEIEPGEAYRLFRGKDPSIDALMRDRGFPVPVM